MGEDGDEIGQKGKLRNLEKIRAIRVNAHKKGREKGEKDGTEAKEM